MVCMSSLSICIPFCQHLKALTPILKWCFRLSFSWYKWIYAHLSMHTVCQGKDGISSGGDAEWSLGTLSSWWRLLCFEPAGEYSEYGSWCVTIYYFSLLKLSFRYPYIVFRFRFLYGFMFVYIYIYIRPPPHSASCPSASAVFAPVGGWKSTTSASCTGWNTMCASGLSALEAAG